MDKKLQEILTNFKSTNGMIAILTGAGISAESGIPTFRGEEGYWVVGSKNYRPEEMATFRMFTQMPDEIWLWYLYRKTICNNAKPNKGHEAVVELEKMYKDKFCLITQNVDGLHVRAGNTLDRTFMIHGNIDYMRCTKECTKEIYPIPDDLVPKSKTDKVTDKDKKHLVCPKCGAMSRPHVLWFDECYDEHYYKYESSINVASKTDLLIVVGTSGATNLPMQIGQHCRSRGTSIIDINPTPNPFSSIAENMHNGYYYQGPSGDILPKIVTFLKN